MNNKGWGISDLLWILGVIGASLVLVSVLIRVSLKDSTVKIEDSGDNRIETVTPEEAPEELESDDENVEIEVNDTESYSELEELLKSSAEEYVKKYYNDESVSRVTISLSELEQEAFVSGLTDPNDSNVICDGYVIYIKESNNYQPYIKCGSNYQTPGY